MFDKITLDGTSEDVEGVFILTLAEFEQACCRGSYNDHDGYGYYGNATKDLNVQVSCSDAAHGRLS
jgi:hypothetical protein